MIGSVNVPGASAADMAVINNTLNNKVDKETGKGLSTNDYTTAEKTKLSGLKNYVSGTGIEIENDGTINCTSTVTVDSALSTSSENPVQNKVVTEAIEEVQDWLEGFKLPPGLILSAYSTELLTSMSVQVTAAWEGGGALSVESSDTDIAAVSFSGDTITITGGASSGAAIITVRVSETEYHQAAAATIYVTNLSVEPTLANNTPAQIKVIAQTGLAANIWSVGDRIGIPLSGTAGALTLSDTYYAFILGFDHNLEIEGANSIHFALGMDSSGTRIAFCNSKYASYGSTTYFNMNTSDTNVGGWEASQMRTNIIPAFKALLPAEWQNVISACTKYSDNTGGSSNTASYVTSTSDDLFLLSEFELWGKRIYANSAEQNYQKQYAYFANGNSKVFYKHNSTSTACYYWLRSVSASSTSAFCDVKTDGSAGRDFCTGSWGLVPCFVIK